MEPPPVPSLGRFRIRVMVFAPDTGHDLKATPKHSFLVAKGPNLPLQDLTLQQLCEEVLRRFRNMFPREPLFDIQNSQDATGSELYHNDRVGDIFVDNEVFRIVQGSTVRDSLQPFEHRARSQSLRPYENIRPVTPGYNGHSLPGEEHSSLIRRSHQISNLDPDKPVRSCERDESEIIVTVNADKRTQNTASEKHVDCDTQDRGVDDFAGDTTSNIFVRPRDTINQKQVDPERQDDHRSDQSLCERGLAASARRRNTISEKRVEAQSQDDQRVDQCLRARLPAAIVTCGDTVNEGLFESEIQDRRADQSRDDINSSTSGRHRKTNTPKSSLPESEVFANVKNKKLTQEMVSRKYVDHELQKQNVGRISDDKLQAMPTGHRTIGTPISPLLGSRPLQFASTAIIEESDYESCPKFPRLPTSLNRQGGKQQAQTVTDVLPGTRNLLQNPDAYFLPSPSRSLRPGIIKGSVANRQHELCSMESPSTNKNTTIAVEILDQSSRGCLTPPDSSQQPASDQSFIHHTEVGSNSPVGKRVRSPSPSGKTIMSPTKKLKRPVTPKKGTRPPIRMESIYDDIRSDCESIQSFVPARTIAGPGHGRADLPSGLSCQKMRRATTTGPSRSPRTVAQPRRQLSESRPDIQHGTNSTRAISLVPHGKVHGDEAFNMLQVRSSPLGIMLGNESVQQTSSVMQARLHTARSASVVDTEIDHVLATPSKAFKPAFTRKSPQKMSGPKKVNIKAKDMTPNRKVVLQDKLDQHDSNVHDAVHDPRMHSVSPYQPSISKGLIPRVAQDSIAMSGGRTGRRRIMDVEDDSGQSHPQSEQDHRHESNVNMDAIAGVTAEKHGVADLTEGRHYVAKNHTPRKISIRRGSTILDLTEVSTPLLEPSSSTVSIETQMPLPSKLVPPPLRKSSRKPVLVTSTRNNLQQTTLIPIIPRTPDSKDKGKAPMKPNFSDKTISQLEHIKLKVENMEPTRIENPIYISSDCDSVYEPGGFSDIEEIYTTPKRARNNVTSSVATVKQHDGKCQSAKLEDGKPITTYHPLPPTVTKMRQTEAISISSDDASMNGMKHNRKRRKAKSQRRRMAMLAPNPSNTGGRAAATVSEDQQATAATIDKQTTNVPKSKRGELSGDPMRIVSPIERLAITLDQKDTPADPPQKFFPSSQETAPPVKSVNTYGLPPINVANEIKKFEKRACTDNHSEALDRLYLYMFENEKRQSKLCPEELYSDDEIYGRTRHRSGIGYAPSLHRMASAATKIERLMGPAMEAALHRVMQRESVPLRDHKAVYESSEESVSETELDNSEHSEEEEENDSDLCRRQLNSLSTKTSPPATQGLGLHKDFLGLLAKCKKNTEERKKQNSGS